MKTPQRATEVSAARRRQSLLSILSRLSRRDALSFDTETLSLPVLKLERRDRVLVMGPFLKEPGASSHGQRPSRLRGRGQADLPVYQKIYVYSGMCSVFVTLQCRVPRTSCGVQTVTSSLWQQSMSTQQRFDQLKSMRAFRGEMGLSRLGRVVAATSIWPFSGMKCRLCFRKLEACLAYLAFEDGFVSFSTFSVTLQALQTVHMTHSPDCA